MPTPEELKILLKMKKTAKGAYKKAKDTTPKVKGQQLPGGLTHAVAQLTSYKFGLDKRNSPYVIMTGVVTSPPEYAGAKANISHFFRASERKSVEEKYEAFFSDLQLLGINTQEMDSDTVLEECLAALEELKNQKVPFIFNTWRPDGQDNTYIFVQGLADDFSQGEGEDEEDEEEETEEDEEEEVEEETEDEEVEDEEDEEEAEAEDDDWCPALGEVYGFQVNARSPIFPCEVVGVDPAKMTVDLKRERDSKEFKKIAWDRLTEVEE